MIIYHCRLFLVIPVGQWDYEEIGIFATTYLKNVSCERCQRRFQAEGRTS